MSQKPDDVISSISQETIRRAKVGDENAIAELFSFYDLSIAYYLAAYVEEEIVSELTKQTFEQARRELPNISTDTKIDIWLRDIATRILHTYLQLLDWENFEKHSQIPFIDQLVPHSTDTLRIRIGQEPLTAHSLSAILATMTDLHTRCWLIQQRRFSDLIDYTQTHISTLTKEANLRVGTMTHNSPAMVDLLLNAGTIAGAATTLVFALKGAVDAIGHIPLRYEAVKLKNLKEKQDQEIQGKQATLDLEIAAKRFEIEAKLAQQEQQLEARRKLLELEKQRMLLDIEKERFEVEVEKQRTTLDRERLELEKNRIIIVQKIAVTMIGQLLSSEDREDAGRTEMLVHSLIPSLLQLAATDAVVTVVSTEPQKEEDKHLPNNK